MSDENRNRHPEFEKIKDLKKESHRKKEKRSIGTSAPMLFIYMLVLIALIILGLYAVYL